MLAIDSDNVIRSKSNADTCEDWDRYKMDLFKGQSWYSFITTFTHYKWASSFIICNFYGGASPAFVANTDLQRFTFEWSRDAHSYADNTTIIYRALTGLSSLAIKPFSAFLSMPRVHLPKIVELGNINVIAAMDVCMCTVCARHMCVCVCRKSCTKRKTETKIEDDVPSVRKIIIQWMLG